MKTALSKKNLILIFVISGICAFFVFRYVDLLHVKARIELELTQAVRQAGFLDAQLKDERAKVENLSREKSALKQGLDESEAKAARLNSENLEAQGHIFSLIGEIQGLERKVDNILEEKTRIEDDLKALEEKNSLMEAKLTSIPELKKEIRNLKKKRRLPALTPKFELKELSPPKEALGKDLKEPPADRVFSFPDEDGNSGFIVKDGEPTYKKRLGLLEAQPRPSGQRLWQEETKPRPSGQRLKIEVRTEL